MTKPTISQSQKRFQESVGSLFTKIDSKSDRSCLFLKSSSDIGVMRNGGRNGARFAPQSFLSVFKKFAQNKAISQFSFLEVEVSSAEEEERNFQEAQIEESRRMASALSQNPHSNICHIGGGHDHIYPLLVALTQDYKKIVVINIDAHADTRTDDSPHSGTPFRQFADRFNGEFFIYQLGLHPFANSSSTLSPLTKGQAKCLWRQDLNQNSIQLLFKEVASEVDDSTLVVFSLDADALLAAEVPGVSAVNPAGITLNELREIWLQYSELPITHRPVIGIYELNPVYDTVSSLSMRTLAAFLYETFKEER